MPNRIPHAHPPSSAKVNSTMRQSLQCAHIASDLGCMEKFAQPLAHRRRHRDTDFGGVDDDSWESHTSFLSAGTCLGYPCSSNAKPVSVVSMEAEISQQVGELRCVRCMHAKRIAPASHRRLLGWLLAQLHAAHSRRVCPKRLKVLQEGIESRLSHFRFHESRQLDNNLSLGGLHHGAHAMLSSEL